MNSTTAALTLGMTLFGVIAYASYLDKCAELSRKGVIYIGGRSIRVEIASEDQELGCGLAGRTLVPGRGMLFVFGRESLWPMWMLDVPEALDIVFLSREGVVVGVERGEPGDPRIVQGPIPYKYVLEVPEGSGIDVGQRATLYLNDDLEPTL